MGGMQPLGRMFDTCTLGHAMSCYYSLNIQHQIENSPQSTKFTDIIILKVYNTRQILLPITYNIGQVFILQNMQHWTYYIA